MDSAEKVISRFREVLSAGVNPADSPVLHAEVLHQFCTADGLLELLDWTRQGLGADPLACMWLGSLRWYRLVTGSFPESAPQPPSRALDAELHKLRGTGRLELQPGTHRSSVAGLASGQMAYPSAPAQAASADSVALLRVVPIGLVPYIDESMRRAWARQSVALTHGQPELLDRAEDLAVLVFDLASGTAIAPAGTDTAQAAIQSPETMLAGVEDLAVREILARQLVAAAGSDLQEPDSADDDAEGVLAVIARLAQQWEEVTRVQQR